MEQAVDKQTANATHNSTDLSSQIMGLKKVAAANRHKTTKNTNKQTQNIQLSENIQEPSPPVDQNQFGTRSSSHTRLTTSQQPRQGGAGQARQNKNRKSLQGGFFGDESGNNQQINNHSNNSNEDNNDLYGANETEQRRSKARLRELQRHVDMGQQKKSQSTTRQYTNDELANMRSNMGTASQKKRLESGNARKSQQFQVYESFSQMLGSSKAVNASSNFFKHSANKNMGSSKKSHSTGRSGLPKGNNSSSKRQMKEQSNQILGIVAAQSMRYQSQINRETNQSFYQPNPTSVPQRKSQELYKAYMNHLPQTQLTQVLASETPISGSNTNHGGVQLAPNLQQDLNMINRHNNLVQKNKRALQSNANMSNIQQQMNNSAGLTEQLPLINNHAAQMAVHKQYSGDPQESPENTQGFAPYQSLKQTTANKNRTGQQSFGKMSTMGFQPQSKFTGINPSATTQVHYNTSSLEQYNNHQFASINQSALIRNINYSILQGELENEAALEDMHMFFVAFNKRQKRIVEVAEEPKLKNNINVAEGTTEDDNGINVTVLNEELDLE